MDSNLAGVGLGGVQVVDTVEIPTDGGSDSSGTQEAGLDSSAKTEGPSVDAVAVQDLTDLLDALESRVTAIEEKVFSKKELAKMRA